MKNKFSHESGFTLIEVMIAAVLLVIGLLAFGIFSGTIVQKNALLERKTIASTAAQGKIEELKNDALTAPLTPADNGNDNLDAEGNSTGGVASIFTRVWTITAAEPATITVTVAWVGPGNTPIVLSTLLSQD